MHPKDVVCRFVEEYQTGADESAFDELMHPDVVDHSRPPGIASGAEGVHQQFDGFRAAFPDFRARVFAPNASFRLVPAGWVSCTFSRSPFFSFSR